MGAAISTFIEGVENQDEKKKMANDALNALKLLCDVKAKAFFDEIVSDTASAGAKLLPVDTVTAKDHQTYCNFSRDAQKTGDEVNNAIGYYVKGEILQGLTTTISTAINKLVGAVSSNVSERRGYAIAVGPLGGIYRVDYLLYYYKYSSKAITEVCEEMLLQCWVISSPNVDQLNTNTLNVILQQSYSPKKDEPDDDFNKRLERVQTQVRKELDADTVRKAVLKHKTEAAIIAVS